MSTTNNIGLFFPDRMREATITGGSWLSSAPVTNVATDQPSETARSTNATNASTKILADLGSTRKLRAFALCRHNLSLLAQWRILLGTTSGGSDVLATSWTDCWNLSAQQAAFEAIGVEDGSSDLPDECIIMVLGAYYSARYVTIEIDDDSNADGYVEIGRAFAAGGFIPGENASYGLKKLRPSQSTVGRSQSGAQWPYRNAQGGGVSFALEWLTPAEKLVVDEMQRQLDITNEVLYVPDIGDATATQRDGFIGLLRELGAIDYPHVRTRSWPVAIDRRL